MDSMESPASFFLLAASWILRVKFLVEMDGIWQKLLDFFKF